MTLSMMLIASVLLINYSFTTRSVIALHAPDGLDDDVIVTTPAESFVLRKGQSMNLYGIQECTIQTHLVGCGWASHAKMPTKQILVDLCQVYYIIPEHIRIKEIIFQHKDFRLRFLAVSAPFWISSADTALSQRLDSRTPFSLQNAVRCGAREALIGNGAWSRSNWSDPRLLSEAVCLFNYADESEQTFIEKLNEIQPHILFIGSMTLSFPGAIRFASLAKEHLGNNVYIILGGKHVNETIYAKNGVVEYHVGSPTLLMQQGKIPPVFDLVVSGDGEEVVRCLGEYIGNDILHGKTIQPFSTYVKLFSQTRGNFILSWIEEGFIRTWTSSQSLDYDRLPSPISLFGPGNTSFSIFEKDMTAHVYSDMGKGCVFGCFFCSENSRINGKIVKTGSPAQRLYNQLHDASIYGESISAFIEDSILLSGNPSYLNQLADLLENHPLNIVFGGQFTIDNLLNPDIQQSIVRLSKNGLVYIYTGIETANENVASAFSKNTGTQSWIERNTEAVQFLATHHIKYGVSVLWGLGESQHERIAQLEMIRGWQNIYRIPSITSFNWATQHPLFNQSSYDYVDWGTDKSSNYLSTFVKLFGEASEKYILSGTTLPTLQQLHELEEKISTLS